ncbi:hypothetical protein [Photobacterium sp. 53610]
MKKKSPSGKSRKDKHDDKGDNPNKIHQIRRKIEDILLEREQKKLLDF